jgi:hypothetical protein
VHAETAAIKPMAAKNLMLFDICVSCVYEWDAH